MKDDKVIGAVLLLIGIASIFNALQIHTRLFNSDPGPALFPIFAGTILALCGLGMMVSAFVGAGGGTNVRPSRDEWRRGTVISVLFIAYGVILWLFGFYIATPVMTYVLYHVLAGAQRRRIWIGVVFAAAVTLSVHLVFGAFLNTLLPTGLLI